MLQTLGDTRIYMYNYKESVRKHGYKKCLIGFVITTICLGLIFVIWNDKAKGYAGYFYLVILPIISVPGVLMLIVGLIQIIKGGVFNISVSSKELLWGQPSYLGKSFHSDLTQIDYIKKVTRTKKSGKVKSKYFLVSKTSKDFQLNNQSGVSIDAVVESLISNGIEIREIKTL